MRVSVCVRARAHLKFLVEGLGNICIYGERNNLLSDEKACEVIGYSLFIISVSK